MKKRQELLYKLLTTFHLNVEERKEFIQRPINFAEIQKIVEDKLKTSKYFPDNLTFDNSGRPIFEGNFIEVTSDKYFLHYQRYDAANPFKIVETFQKEYLTLKDIITDYLSDPCTR